MTKQREIDHVISDPSFEVREGRLTEILSTVAIDARRTHAITSVAEIAGSSFMTLILTIVSVDHFKSIAGLSGEVVYGGVLMLACLSLIVFLVTGTMSLMAKRKPVDIKETIRSLIESESVYTSDLQRAEEIKMPKKASAQPTPLFLFTSYLNDRLGSSPIQEAELYLNGLGIDRPTLDSLVMEATREGYVLIKERTLYLTQLGQDFFRETRDEIARRAFFDSNFTVKGST